ncbi:MAG TPA: 2,3-bisphosphoglycerate-independent phosphoglycerate mutase [Patescibacteria group bacterium]|nr:2,3-bisphosphoglycerate-independent phosphoglycerate mutase [Patescibacteria group bacterium]
MPKKLYKKVLLIILDGFGVATAGRGNAVTLANPPNLNDFVNKYAATTLQASGPAVGLPWGENGNSEAGHLNIGSGRIVGQDMPRINLAIEDRSFFSNPSFMEAIEHAKANNSNLHLMGMVSPGGLHSFDEHLYALIGLAAEAGIGDRTYVHMFTDGEDSKETALQALDKLQKRMDRIHAGKIATIMGRFYAMDRADHWNLTEQAYRCMVFAEGQQEKSALNALTEYASQNIKDHMIPPTVILQADGSAIKITDGDALIHFNYRPDRAIQLTKAFTEQHLKKFIQPYTPLKDIIMVTMTEYIDGLNVKIAFPPIPLTNGLAEMISKRGLRQFHCAESEKFAHVSIFFDGGIHPFPGEDREIVSSPASNYQNYANSPEMSAYQLTDMLIGKLDQNYTFYVVNFANTDMVGHTGNPMACIQAVTSVDTCLGKLAAKCLQEDICMIITADHGNIEEIIDHRSGNVETEHSSNPVPFIIIANDFARKNPKGGGIESLAGVLPVGVLSDVAPTVLELLGIPKPSEMTGVSLLGQVQPQVK